LDRLQKELEGEKQVRDQAQEEREKIAAKQRALDTLQQSSSLITAAAQLFAATAALGPVGTAIAIGAIAAMFTAFGVSKVQAGELAKAEHGLTFIEDGNRHAQGGNKHNNWGVESEKGERISIFSRKAVSQYDSKIVDFTKAVNSGNLDNLKWRFGSEGLSQSYAFMSDNRGIESRLDAQTEHLKKTNEYLAKGRYYHGNGRSYTDANGNETHYT
jgi:hypothetical protein